LSSYVIVHNVMCLYKMREKVLIETFIQYVNDNYMLMLTFLFL